MAAENRRDYTTVACEYHELLNNITAEPVEEILDAFYSNPSDSRDARSSQPSAKTSPDNYPQQGRQPTRSTAYLRMYPVIGRIPAGGLKSVEGLRMASVYTDVYEVVIDRNIYGIKNLQEGQQITLRSDDKYFVLKVTGNSMDLAGIDDGDYVLLRYQQSPDHQDIVAAEVIGVDVESTLKRYLERRNEIILQPESTDEKYKPLKFSSKDNIRISGVALAVLKLLEPLSV